MRRVGGGQQGMGSGQRDKGCMLLSWESLAALIMCTGLYGATCCE